MIETLLNLEWEPFLVSFKLAFYTTLILFIISIPFSWYLSQTKSKLKPVLEAITALPIVLPPTVIGFYILFTLSTNSPIGAFFEETFGIRLVFNFTSLVIASCFYSLPFMVQPLQAAMQNMPKSLVEASYICGKSKIQTILYVILPNIKPAVITAIVTTFAHTIGEFGVVLMVGGSIPGETKVASIAIYEFVEMLDYESAHIYSAIMVTMSFLVLFCVYYFNFKQGQKMSNQ
jgi:molybdate transport system permease protein